MGLKLYLIQIIETFKKLTRSKTVIFPVENIIAFVGVATGSIKAALADITTGSITNNGLMAEFET